jgi:hypothetical protein
MGSSSTTRASNSKDLQRAQDEAARSLADMARDVGATIEVRDADGPLLRVGFKFDRMRSH